MEMTEQEFKEQKLERKSPFKNWYQFNREHTKDIIALASKHGKAHAILMFLLDQMDDYNAVVCSYQVFEDALDIAQATVARAIRVLKDTGFVVVLKSGTTNAYVVSPDLAWSSWGNNRQYCQFPANVIISAAENSSFFANVEKNKSKMLSIRENLEKTGTSEE